MFCTRLQFDVFASIVTEGIELSCGVGIVVAGGRVWQHGPPFANMDKS